MTAAAPDLAAAVRPGPASTARYVAAAAERWGWRHTGPGKGEPAWLDGAVALRPPPPAADRYPLTDPADPLLGHADTVLRAWPAVRAECRALLDAIWSGGMGLPGVFRLPALGGACDGPDPWGTVFTAAHNPVGYAEGIAHNLAHNKLRALGVGFDAHDGTLLTNPPGVRYVSPLRAAGQRPMSAVLHAHYSYLHVTECELRAATVGYDISPMAPTQQQRLTDGRAVLAAHARWTGAGEGFGDGVLAWTDELLDGLARWAAAHP